jgi:hypothetical protein
MTDTSKKGKSDDIKINMKQSYEVQYWTRKWGITPLQLEAAVRAVGNSMAREVEEYLRQTGKIIDL